MTVGESFGLFLLLAWVVLPIVGIVDAIKHPDENWVVIGQRRLAWIFLQLFFGILGTLAYLFSVRPKLQRLL